MSSSDAAAYQPDKPACVIRIFSAYQRGDSFWEEPLAKSEFYKSIETYYFDDIWPGIGSQKEILLDDDLASRIINNFAKNKNGCETLIVHCSRGINRSPAVAIALNEIFGLGHKSSELKKKYDESNWYVYNKLIEAGKKYQLK